MRKRRKSWRPTAPASTEAVARGYYKLLAYKDEYEVARLFTSGSFEAQITKNFDGVRKIEFHLAPPLLAWFNRDKETGHPRKMTFGPWMMTAFRFLAKRKHLRGTRWDVFGYTAERRRERQMITDYEKLARSDHAETDARTSRYGHGSWPDCRWRSRASGTSKTRTMIERWPARRHCWQSLTARHR